MWLSYSTDLVFGFPKFSLNKVKVRKPVLMNSRGSFQHTDYFNVTQKCIIPVGHMFTRQLSLNGSELLLEFPLTQRKLGSPPI